MDKGVSGRRLGPARRKFPQAVKQRGIVDDAQHLVLAAELTWRMIFGGLDMYNYNELSMTINFPRWTTFPISIAMLGFLTIVIAYTIGRSIAGSRAGRYFDRTDETA